MTKLHLSPDFALPLDAVTQTFGVLAVRGAGKTYTAAVLTEELIKAGERVCVIDPIGVWWGLRSSADGKAPGLPVLILGGEHADVPLEVSAGAVIAEFVAEERPSCVLDLSLFRKGEQGRFLTDFAERLYHRNREPLHLVMDEADAFAPQRPLPGQQRLLGAIEDLVRRGRARGLGCTLITQRAAVLNKDVLTQIETLIALRTIAPQDRNAIDGWVKVHGDEAERAKVMGSLASLKRGEAWVWSPGWLQLLQRVQIRTRETFDSSATPTHGGKKRRREPQAFAPVDLEGLSKRIADTIERAKADDPRELRRRIAELEAAAGKPQQGLGELERATRAAQAFGFEPTEQTLADWITHERPKLDKAVSTMIEMFARQVDTIGEYSTHAKKVVELLGQKMAPRRVAPPPPELETRKPKQKSSNGSNGHAATLPEGEAKVLTAIVQQRNGATREQLSLLTGYKRSTRDRYLQKLRARDLVVETDGRIYADGSAADVLGNFEPLPTGAALLQHWLTRLPEGERAVLKTVAKGYPNAVDREEISELTGYKRSTRDRYLQKLAARRLVSAQRNGVLASAELFS